MYKGLKSINLSIISPFLSTLRVSIIYIILVKKELMII